MLKRRNAGMKKRKIRYRYFLKISILTCLIWLALGNVSEASAGRIYSCRIVPSYRHPVTGKIEDSGGSAGAATGQGMVESCVASKGLLEQTDSGKIYLTFRMGLIDQTSGHRFSVQKRGESGWKKATVEQTRSGKDKNGTTADLRMKVPDKNVILRCVMRVDPMGRDVIFYFYPENFTGGNTTGMKAEVVTESSKTDTQNPENEENKTATERTQESDKNTQSTKTRQGTSSQEELEQAEGLSLSTRQEKTTEKKSKKENSILREIFVLTVSITISGRILLAAAAGIVYHFRKNWERFVGDKEEYEELYEDKK